MDLQEFIGFIDVMKPATVKKDDLKQVAKLDSLLDSPDYAIEEKIDGCHYFMIGCQFFSADKVEKTNNFPHQFRFFMDLGMPNLILDGEIFYPGKTSQYCTRVTGSLAETAISFQDTNGPIHFKVWDILRTPAGKWLNNYTYTERRKILSYFFEQYVMPSKAREFIHLSEMRINNKREFLDGILSSGGEGAVLKRLDGLYLMGKKPKWNWMKIKQNDEADLVVMSFDKPKKKYTGKNFETWPYWVTENGIEIPVTKFYYNNWIGALRLGAYVNGTLKEICTASGINEALRKAISEDPEMYKNRVVRISFMERTEAGYPRHPSFENFHEDKRPEECIWEFGGQ